MELFAYLTGWREWRLRRNRSGNRPTTTPFLGSRTSTNSTEMELDLDERFLEHDEDHLAIPSQDITESLRRCVLQEKQDIVPVFAGASFRNVGVQPLLDAVVDLLPSPNERPDPGISIGGVSGGLQQM